MIYDRKTGDVQIIDKEANKPKKTIIRSNDDQDRERAALYKELDSIEDPEAKAERHAELFEKFEEHFDFEMSKFPVRSRDNLRIDIGLMIQRPPIFLHMSERDIEFMKMRSQIMHEYSHDQKQYIDEITEVSKLNEDLLTDNSYVNVMNLDNHPTHQLNGETYCAASKDWKLVDPACEDWRSLHYAAGDRCYLLFRNKYTQEWEFPTMPVYWGQTFMRCKQDLFNIYSSDKWKVKFFGALPLIHTIRKFSAAEKEDSMNNDFDGVRTYFYGAHHFRGLPVFPDMAQNTDHDDYAWVPKRKMNEFLTKEYHEVFIHSMRTR